MQCAGCRGLDRELLLQESLRDLQQEFADEKFGFRAAKHQSFVGAGYFDAVQNTIMDGLSSTTAMDGSTEEEQFVA